MTTIIALKKDKKIFMGGDGQATLGGRLVVKSTVKKIRRIYNNKIIIGFSGAIVDCMVLYKLLEDQLHNHQGKLLYSATEMLRELKKEKSGYTLNLESYLIAADKKHILLIVGTGEVMEVEEAVIGIGSGGHFAQSAATALLENTSLSGKEIIKKSLDIASSLDVMTNNNYIIEEV